MSAPLSADELDDVEMRIEAWLAQQRDDNPIVAAVERDLTSGERRWFVRVRGDEKDVFSIWLHLQQRSLHYETYVMPAPEEDEATFYRYLLRHNVSLRGASFAVGEEDAVFLMGHMDARQVDDDQLDRMLGSLYAYTERFFRPALQIGFASRVRSPSQSS